MIARREDRRDVGGKTEWTGDYSNKVWVGDSMLKKGLLLRIPSIQAYKVRAVVAMSG